MLQNRLLNAPAMSTTVSPRVFAALPPLEPAFVALHPCVPNVCVAASVSRGRSRSGGPTGSDHYQRRMRHLGENAQSVEEAAPGIATRSKGATLGLLAILRTEQEAITSRNNETMMPTCGS